MTQIPPQFPVHNEYEKDRLVDPCRTDQYYYEDEVEDADE